MKGANAVGTDADDADGHLKLAFEKIEVRNEVRGELGSVSNVREVGVPAGEGEVFGGDGGEFAGVG